MGRRRSACSIDHAMVLHFIFIVTLITGGGASLSNPNHFAEHSKLGSFYPATGNLLIGRESRLFASSTCGLQRPERYCIESNIETKNKCFYCDSTKETLQYYNLNHGIQNAVHKVRGTTSWWQSENGKENVTIQLDMEAEFLFTHLFIKFKTMRPAAMMLERSVDYGKTWRVYKYFSDNCDNIVPQGDSTVTEVNCESRFSKAEPSTNGELIFRGLTHNITDRNSKAVNNLLRMTNLRINFTKLHTLSNDTLDDQNVQEKYYYAAYEIIVRGMCSCYGHSTRCLPMPGVEHKPDMVQGRCQCNHNTKGLNCDQCEDFYNDVPWHPAGETANACKRCTCNNHAYTCHFDAALYKKSGNKSGGVCDNCQHNTMGVNCEQCKPTFYKDPNMDIQSPDICRPCDCDVKGSVDEVCDNLTGQCKCRPNVSGRRCETSI